MNPEPPSTGQLHSPSNWPWILCLSSIVFLAFRAGMHNGLVGDDWVLIDWCRPHGISFLLEVFDPVRDSWYYRPVTKLVFGLFYFLFGLEPAPYHLLSLAAHATAAVLLFLVVRRTGADAFPSFLCALFFAVHYRQHEGVFWFSAISYPLSTALGLASMLSFRSYLDRRHRRHLVASLITLAAALLTKDTAVVFPALVGLYGLLFPGLHAPPRDLRKDWVSLIPLGIVLLGVLVLQGMPIHGRFFARGGASFSPKGLAATADFLKQVIVLTVPGLDVLNGTAQAAAASAAGLGFAGFVLIRRTRVALFGFLWAALAHLPFYLFVPRTGDLYQYLALAGCGLVVADASTWVLHRLSSSAVRPVNPAAAALALAFGVFFAWSIARIQVMAIRWRAAGEVVTGVVNAVRAARPSLRTDDVLAFEGLPDRVDGTYAFLNAVPSVFRLSLDDDALRCVPLKPGDSGFLWEKWRFFQVSGEGERRLLRSFEDLSVVPGGPALGFPAELRAEIIASGRLDGSVVTLEIDILRKPAGGPPPITLLVDVYAAENPSHPDRHYAFWAADLAGPKSAQKLVWRIDLETKDNVLTVDDVPVTSKTAGVTVGQWKGPLMDGPLKGVLAVRRPDFPEQTRVFDLFSVQKTGRVFSRSRFKNVAEDELLGP